MFFYMCHCFNFWELLWSLLENGEESIDYVGEILQLISSHYINFLLYDIIYPYIYIYIYMSKFHITTDFTMISTISNFNLIGTIYTTLWYWGIYIRLNFSSLDVPIISPLDKLWTFYGQNWTKTGLSVNRSITTLVWIDLGLDFHSY
jgi:hypothetical protein